MNDSFGGGFNATQTGGVPAEKRVEGIAPMVVKQVLKSGDDGLTLCGVRVASASLVVIVRKSEITSTKITYLLEDHTGQINAHYWLEEGDTISQPRIADNTYVRAYGSARNTDGQKTLILFRIEALQSANELTNHLLEALYARYRAEDVAKGKVTLGDKTSSNGTGDFASGRPAGGAGGAGGGFNDYAMNSLNPKQQLIYDAIRKHGSVDPNGISMSELQRKFSHMSSAELNQITEFMMNEGHIYTSIDSNHFLTTDG